jgi:hypothetical protein
MPRVAHGGAPCVARRGRGDDRSRVRSVMAYAPPAVLLLGREIALASRNTMPVDGACCLRRVEHS